MLVIKKKKVFLVGKSTSAKVGHIISRILSLTSHACEEDGGWLFKIKRDGAQMEVGFFISVRR